MQPNAAQMHLIQILRSANYLETTRYIIEKLVSNVIYGRYMRIQRKTSIATVRAILVVSGKSFLNFRIQSTANSVYG